MEPPGPVLTGWKTAGSDGFGVGVGVGVGAGVGVGVGPPDEELLLELVLQPPELEVELEVELELEPPSQPQMKNTSRANRKDPKKIPPLLRKRLFISPSISLRLIKVLYMFLRGGRFQYQRFDPDLRYRAILKRFLAKILF